mgnify:CR=1 FL=1
MFGPDEVPVTILFRGITKHYFPIAALFRAAKELELDSVTIDVNNDGFISASMDRSHVRYYEFRFPREAFDNYELRQNLSFSIDRRVGEKIARIWDELSHDYYEHAIKLYRLEGKRERDRGLFFAVGLEGVQFALKVKEETIVPSPVSFGNYHAYARVDADELLKALKPVAKLKLDTIKLELSGDELVLTHRDEITGTEKALGSLRAHNAEGSASSYYSVEYFVPLLRIIREFSSEVRLTFGDDYPIKMSTVWSVGELAFVIAPRKSLNLAGGAA